MPVLFSTFSAAHLIAIAISIGTPLVLAWVTHGGRRPKLARTIRLALAAMLMSAWALWYFELYRRGWLSELGSALPMQLCDWASAVVIVTLLRPNIYTYEVAYFWALAGTVQALLTPDLQFDFPDVAFIVFFLLHGGTVASALYLTLALHLRPVPMSLVRASLWSLFYLGTALAVNATFGTNFGYLSSKPSQPSLLDYLGPWPDYIFMIVAIAALSFAIYYAPFFFIDIARRRKRNASL